MKGKTGRAEEAGGRVHRDTHQRTGCAAVWFLSGSFLAVARTKGAGQRLQTKTPGKSIGAKL